MKLIQTEVKTYRIDAECDCGGTYEPTGVMLTSYPPQYPHRCNICGHEKRFETTYPKIEYREVANASKEI